MTASFNESGIRHKLLPFGAMTWRERSLILTSYALLTLAAASVVRQDPSGPGAEIRTLALWLSAVGWTLLLAGAAYVSVLLELGIVFVMLALTRFPQPMQFNLYREGWIWFRDLLFIAGGALALIVFGRTIIGWLGRFGQDEEERPRPLGAFVASVFVVSIAHLPYWAGREDELLDASFEESLANLSILLIPLLFAAAADMTEWTDIAGERTGRLFERPRARRLLVPATAIVAVACIAGACYRLRDSYSPQAVALYVTLFVLAILGAVWFARRTSLLERVQGDACPRRVYMAAALMFCVAFLGAALGPYYWFENPRVQVTEPHEFSLNSVPGWQTEVYHRTANESVVRFRDGLNNVRVVVWYQRVDSGTPESGRWVESRADSPAAIIWERVEHGVRWKIIGFVDPETNDDESVLMPAFERMRDSFRAGPEPYMPVYRAEAAVALVGVLFVLIAAPLLSLRDRMAPTWLIFLGLTGLLLFLGNLRSLQFFVTGWPRDRLDVYEGTTTGLLIAVATLGVLAWLAGARRNDEEKHGFVHAMLVLNIAVLLIVILGILLPLALRHGATNYALKGAIIWLAATWDVATSGDVLRGHSKRFPRESRTLFFAGYGLLLAAVLLAGSPLRVAGAPALPFDDELWTDYGLEDFGIPLLLTFFVIRLSVLSARLRQNEVEAAAGAAP